MARKLYVGDAAIGRAIKSLNGALENVNLRVQDIAISIVDHAAHAGNGDVSRALQLCQLVKRHRTLNVNYLVGWFAYFGNCNVNLNTGKVSLISKDSKRYRGFDVEGAKANNWFEAVDEQGNRSLWYSGPQPADYVPDGIGDVAADMNRFVKRMNDRLAGTKTVNGKEVPLVKLSDEDEKQVHNALSFIERIAATLARHEEVATLAAKLEAATAATEQDDEVVGVIAPKDKAVA